MEDHTNGCQVFGCTQHLDFLFACSLAFFAYKEYKKKEKNLLSLTSMNAINLDAHLYDT